MNIDNKVQVPAWIDIVYKMDAGDLITDNLDYKWFYSCWKAYQNPRKDISKREKWFAGVVERFTQILEKQNKKK